MDGDNDNGYHSSDDRPSGIAPVRIVGEDLIFEDLDYNAREVQLDDPDYDALRESRYERNKDAMRTLDAHVADSMPFLVAPETQTAEETAATVIQKYIRGFLAQRKYIDLLLEHFEKEEKLRREKTMEQVEEAKLLIENHHLEVQFEEYNVVRKNKAQRLACCAITIQRAWRKWIARKNARALIEDRTAGCNECDVIATQLAELALQSALFELMAEC